MLWVLFRVIVVIALLVFGIMIGLEWAGYG